MLVAGIREEAEENENKKTEHISDSDYTNNSNFSSKEEYDQQQGRDQEEKLFFNMPPEQAAKTFALASGTFAILLILMLGKRYTD